MSLIAAMMESLTFWQFDETRIHRCCKQFPLLCHLLLMIPHNWRLDKTLSVFHHRTTLPSWWTASGFLVTCPITLTLLVDFLKLKLGAPLAKSGNSMESNCTGTVNSVQSKMLWLKATGSNFRQNLINKILQSCHKFQNLFSQVSNSWPSWTSTVTIDLSRASYWLIYVYISPAVFWGSFFQLMSCEFNFHG